MKNGIVFTFGRMNPPTRGHLHLANEVKTYAESLDQDHMVYMSLSQKTPARDPLKWKDKYVYAERSFPGINVSDDEAIRTAFMALEDLVAQGYKEITFVVGRDQQKGIGKSMLDWTLANDIQSTFCLKVISRDEGIGKDVSATLAKKQVTDNNFMRFTKTVSPHLTSVDKRALFHKVKEGLESEIKRHT